MLAFTHGQPASPTTLGKEFSNYSYRIKFHLDLIKTIKQKGKFLILTVRKIYDLKSSLECLKTIFEFNS